MELLARGNMLPPNNISFVIIFFQKWCQAEKEKITEYTDRSAVSSSQSYLWSAGPWYSRTLIVIWVQQFFKFFYHMITLHIINALFGDYS